MESGESALGGVDLSEARAARRTAATSFAAAPAVDGTALVKRCKGEPIRGYRVKARAARRAAAAVVRVAPRVDLAARIERCEGLLGREYGNEASRGRFTDAAVLAVSPRTDCAGDMESEVANVKSSRFVRCGARS